MLSGRSRRKPLKMVVFRLASALILLPNALAASNFENSIDASVSAAALSLSRAAKNFLTPGELPRSVSDLLSPAPQFKAGTVAFERPEYGTLIRCVG